MICYVVRVLFIVQLTRSLHITSPHPSLPVVMPTERLIRVLACLHSAGVLRRIVATRLLTPQLLFPISSSQQAGVAQGEGHCIHLRLSP